jgi:hypothetical protein
MMTLTGSTPQTNRKDDTMESYTFRCVNDDCEYHDMPISGITMQKVIDDGGPICGLCGDDLELVGPDHGFEADQVGLRAAERDERRNRPTAYGPVPGPPVNPRDAHPAS